MKRSKLFQMYAVMSLEWALLGAELVASQLTHSLLLLTDAYHTLYNIISILLLIISYKMTSERTLKNTFGWARVEVLGMLVNMTFVVALSFSVLVEGIQQLAHSSHEISEPTNHYLLLAFGTVSLFTNCIYFNTVRVHTKKLKIKKNYANVESVEKPVARLSSDSSEAAMTDSEIPSSSATKSDLQRASDAQQMLLTVQRSSDEQIDSNAIKNTKRYNMFVTITRDMSSSILLLWCALIILTTDHTIAHLSDPVLGILAAVLFCVTFYSHMKDTGFILLQTVPENIDVNRIQKEILKEFPSIINIHDLHIWGLTSSKIIATCHIILPQLSSEEYDQFTRLLNNFFTLQGISLATVQPEFRDNDSQLCLPSCMMKCSNISSNNNCESLTCCNTANETPDTVITDEC